MFLELIRTRIVCFNVIVVIIHSHNTEKVIYFLLLERKKRRPANEDDTVVVKNTKNSFDPPKKRVDTCKMIDDIDSNFSQISAGSPATPRKQMLQ